MKYARINCEICQQEIAATNQNLQSHVKRKHNIDFIEYVKIYYKNITQNNFEIKLCACKRQNAELKYNINHLNKEYYVNYSNGLICNKLECKNVASMEILGKPYNAKEYEHLGSNINFISYKYSITLEEALKFKSNNIDNIKRKNPNLNEKEIQNIFDEIEKNKFDKAFRTNLTDYKIRYGEELGIKKYEERCNKISKSNSKNYYIETYGEELGLNKWNSYVSKLKKCSLGNTKSKVSYEKIYDPLIKKGYNVLPEYVVNCNKVFKVDFYLNEFNVVIEYFGDYWHANPKIFKDELFIHKSIKIPIYEIWNKDKLRLNLIQESLNCSILVIWESTSHEILIEKIEEYIELLKKNKTIIII